MISYDFPKIFSRKSWCWYCIAIGLGLRIRTSAGIGMCVGLGTGTGLLLAFVKLAPKKVKNPMDHPGKSGKNLDSGSGGHGAICNVNLKKRVAQKLRRIILLHFGRITFQFQCTLGDAESPSRS